MILSDERGALRLSALAARPSHDGVIEMEVRTERGTWTTDDPGLERNDLRALTRWLRTLARGRQPKELGFMEPNLRFECLASGEPVQIRVWFEGEARPEWAPYEHWDEQDLWLDLAIPRAELHDAAETLAEELIRVEARS
jgi:hypothetical protein